MKPFILFREENMKRIIALLVVLMAACRPAQADLTYNWDNNTADSDGLVGLHLNRASTDPFAHGISWDIDGKFMWNTGLDITLDYTYPGVSPTPPDLVLAYSSLLHADNLRMRADDARVALGPRIGHPVMPFQLAIAAGLPNSPLGGISVGTYGYQFGLYLYNRNPAEARTAISLQSLYGLVTDSAENGYGDFVFYNYQASAPTFTVQPNNDFCLAARREGFFGSAPVAKPHVTGSWSDGSAQKSLLAALVQLGLATDQTAP
jgi:hypothetical protein